MVHTFQNLENFEFDSRFGNSSTLRSLKYVINIIMWIRDTGCYNSPRSTARCCDSTTSSCTSGNRSASWHTHQRKPGCGMPDLNFGSLRKLAARNMVCGLPLLDQVDQVCDGCLVGNRDVHHSLCRCSGKPAQYWTSSMATCVVQCLRQPPAARCISYY
jgi:hypothetical protein